MIRKNKKGKWIVDITLGGRSGRRVRKVFASRPEASRFEATVIIEWRQKLKWNATEKVDNRCLTELCKLWYEIHGINLKDGEARLKKLNNLCQALKNPKINNFTKQDFIKYRNERAGPGWQKYNKPRTGLFKRCV